MHALSPSFPTALLKRFLAWHGWRTVCCFPVFAVALFFAFILATLQAQAQAQTHSDIEMLIDMERRADEAAQQPVVGKAMAAGAEFSFGLQRFPVIYAGEAILFRDKLQRVETFLPVFSAERGVVNPERPVQEMASGGETRLIFNKAGEYYLAFNRAYPLKVLVLDPQESVTENVARLFDFVTANLVTMEGDDADFRKNPVETVRHFFQSPSPFMLESAQSLDLFMTLVRERFSLPVRRVFWFSPYLQEGTLHYVRHTSAEVYLPDLGKWVLFDPAEGFLVAWKDAFEITALVRKAAQGQDLANTRIYGTDFASIGLPYHYRVVPYLAAMKSRGDYTDAAHLLTKEKVRDRWDEDMAQAFLAGPGYTSGRFSDQSSALPEGVDVYQSAFLDPFLLEAQRRWLAHESLRVQALPPDALLKLLDQSYAEQIARAEWKMMIPERSLRKKPPQE